MGSDKLVVPEENRRLVVRVEYFELEVPAEIRVIVVLQQDYDQ